MPFSGEVGSEQAKIGALETSVNKEKDKAKELAAALDRNHDTFFSEVDTAKSTLDTAEAELTDKNDLNIIGDLKDDLKGYLVNVASTGNEALRNALADKPAQQAKLATIDTMATNVNAKSAELKNTVTFFSAIKHAKSIFSEKAVPNLKKTEEIKNDENLTPAQKKEQILRAADDAIKGLTDSKRTMPTVAPSDFADVLAIELKPINAGLEEMATLKFFYAAMNLCNEEQYKKYFVFDAAEGGSIKFTDAYKALAPEQQQEVQMALTGLKMKIENEIEAKTCANEHEKKYYSGKEKMMAGDKAGAKADLIAFYNTEIKNDEHSPENTQRLSECRELLKQIALFEVAEAEGRLNMIESDLLAQFADVSTGAPPIGMNANLARVYINQMRQVINMARERINTGDALTVANVYKDLQAEADKLSEGPLRSWRMGFQQEGKYNLILDVLRTQQEIDNSSTDPKQKRAKLIEKAKEARALGLFGLAKQYYEKAFQPEIDAKRKEINREEFIQKMRSDAEIQAQIKTHVELWEKDFRPKFIEEYKKAHNGEVPSDEDVEKAYGDNKGQLRENLFNQMAGEAYGKALRTLVHRDMMAEMGRSAPGLYSDAAGEWNLAYGATFVNVENFDVASGEFWKFTDAEWNAKKWEYIVILATTMASGGIAAGLAKGTAGVALTEALAQRGLTAAAMQAAQRGAGAYALFVIKELGVKRAAAYGITNLAVESGAFAVSTHAMNRVIYNEPEWTSARDFLKAWGHSAAFLGGCKIGSLGYSFRPVPVTTAGRILDTAGYLTSEVAASTGMMLTTMLLSGETITAEKFNALLREDIIMTIGMHGAHKLMGAGEAGERASAMEAERTAKMDQLFRSVFLADASKIPPEMMGKPAFIGKDGRVYYAPDAFAEFGVRAETKGKNTIYTVEDVGGPYRGNRVELTEKEFLRITMRAKNGEPLTPLQQALLPTVRAVRDKQIRLKTHEVDHRALETANNATNGRLAKALEKLFAEDPGLKRALEERSAAAKRAKEGFQSIQEFLSEVADGRKEVRLTAEQTALVEGVIAKAGGIKDFTFRGLRNVDTRMLADPRYLREHFTRDAEAGRDADAPQPNMERQMPDNRPQLTEEQIMNGQVPTGSDIVLMSEVTFVGGAKHREKVMFKILGFKSEHWYGGEKKYVLRNSHTMKKEYLSPWELRDRINEMRPRTFHETPGFRAGEKLNLPGSRFDGFYVIAHHPDGTVTITRNEPDISKALVGERTTWPEILKNVEVEGTYIERIYQDRVYVWRRDPSNPNVRIAGPLNGNELYLPLVEVLEQLQNRTPAPERQNINILRPSPVVPDVLRVGQEVYIQRSSGVLESGWVVESVNPDGTYKVRNVKNPKLTRPVIQDLANPAKNEIWSRERIENPADSRDSLGNDAADFERMKIALLKQTELLPSRDFDQLFTDAGLHQENVGNCYMVSAIHSLYNSPHFKFLVQTSVRKVPNGWEVRIPLGDPTAKPILVTEADLVPQRNPEYGKRDKHGEVDDRKYLSPMAGSKGFQVLEAALIRRVTFSNRGALDRLGAEGGFGHQAIIQLLGSAFRKVKLDGTRGLHPTEQRGMAMTAREYSEAPAFSDASPHIARQVRNDLYNFLDDFHPGKYLATANTPPAARGDRARFRIPGVNYIFHNSHAYSVVNVDRFGNPKTVSVVNPHNTTELIKLTYEQFADVFSQVSAAEIDYSTFVAQMRNQS